MADQISPITDVTATDSLGTQNPPASNVDSKTFSDALDKSTDPTVPLYQLLQLKVGC